MPLEVQEELFGGAKLMIFLKNTRRKALDLVLTGEGYVEVGAEDTVFAGVLDSRCGTLLSTFCRQK